MKNRTIKTIAGILFLFLIFFNVSGGRDKTKETNTSEPELKFNTEEVVNAWVSMWNSYNLSLVDRLFLIGSNVTCFSSEKEGLNQETNFASPISTSRIISFYSLAPRM
jgi:hypothetical protein